MLSLIICFVFVNIGYSQEIPKGANLVKFESDSLTDFELFRASVMVLKKAGFAFDQLDKDFYLCSTKPIKPDKINLEYRIELSVYENIIEIRSFVKSIGNIAGNYGSISSISENAWERGAKRSLGTSLWMYGWKRQVAIGKRMDDNLPGKVSYIVEEFK